MNSSDSKTDVLPQRLCSEIQLFDLCDLDSCDHRSGRFCTNPVLLGRFEKIAEDELRVPERYTSEEIDDEEVDNIDGYDDEDGEFVMAHLEAGEDNNSEDEE
jgi:hypothetical protein